MGNHNGMAEWLIKKDLKDWFDEQIDLFSRHHAPLIGWTPQQFKDRILFDDSIFNILGQVSHKHV